MVMRKRVASGLRRLAQRLDSRAEYTVPQPDPGAAAIDRQTKALVALADGLSHQYASGITEAVTAVCWQIVGPQLASMVGDTRNDGVGDDEILDTLLERLSNGFLANAPRA